MANVGSSIRKAIDDWSLGDVDFAMLHACNALDGTAAKLHPTLGSNARFTRVLRENYRIFGPMAVPGVDLVGTRWPVKVDRPKATGGLPDIADVIYGIHRCTHGHGNELPDGFALLADAGGPNRVTRLSIQNGKVHLSDRVVFGLVGVAVLSTANVGQTVPEGYHLTFAGAKLLINDWWGRSDDFLVLAAQERMPDVLLDFGDWMDGKR